MLSPGSVIDQPAVVFQRWFAQNPFCSPLSTSPRSMPDKPRHPAKKDRDAKRVGQPRPASAADAQGGRAWVRPSRRTTGDEPSPGEGNPTDDRDESSGAGHLTAQPPAKKGSDGAFRMRLGAAADEEERAHSIDVARRRVQRLRPWVSALFLGSVLSLLLYVTSLVLKVAGASETAGAVIFLALLSGGLIVLGLGVGCALRLREWRWLAVVGLLPVAAALMAALIPLPPVAVYPVLPISGLVYSWSKRGELFA